MRLKKALYGLKQAPKLWYDTFSHALGALGFQPSEKDACVYVNRGQMIYVILYVDDGLVISKDIKTNLHILDELNMRFGFMKFATNQFLGMELKVEDDIIKVNQKRFIKDLVARFRLEESNHMSSPMHSVTGLIYDTSAPTKAPYREATGAMQYPAQGSRPDILFAVNHLSKYNDCPTEGRWTAPKRVIKYVLSTSNYEI